MENDQDYNQAINLLLWGKKGYAESHKQASSEFSIEKILNFLKQKLELVKTDDI